jgi:zinc D-Ala-D-Ala carboxypeptidase
MKLSEHFTLAEFTNSDTARRRGIDNTPSPAILSVLRITARKLEAVRSLLGVPIIVTSAYRCAVLNRAIGSGPTSHHVIGQAVDFKAPAFGPPLKVARAIERARKKGLLQYDQLIHEFGAWVHISFAPGFRGQAFTIYSAGGRTITAPGLLAVKR